MDVNRRRFGTFLAGAVGALAAGPKAATPGPQTPAPLARAASRLPAATIAKIRVFYPPNYNPNGPQAFPQSNMVVLVDTDAGITGIGQGGSPDTVRNVGALVHESKLTRNDPDPEASHRPMAYESGRPMSVIAFRTWHARSVSASCPPGVRARRRFPMIDLYRKKAFSTRAC